MELVRAEGKTAIHEHGRPENFEEHPGFRQFGSTAISGGVVLDQPTQMLLFDLLVGPFLEDGREHVADAESLNFLPTRRLAHKCLVVRYSHPVRQIAGQSEFPRATICRSPTCHIINPNK